MTKTTADFNWLEILTHTSRSFAVGIQALAAPLDHKVGLCYLLCRLLDTYEDSTEVSAELRVHCLERSIALLKAIADEKPRLEPLLSDWDSFHQIDALWMDQDPWEVRLLKEAPLLWKSIEQFPHEDRKAVSRCVLMMAEGMIEEIKDRQEPANVPPRTLQNTDQYCFYVAGTVGLLLSYFFKAEFAKKDAAVDLNDEISIGFGKALQLVNISKDFYDDWGKGRCYWPGIYPPKSKNDVPPKVDLLEEKFSQMVGLFDKNLAHAEIYMKEIGRLRKLRPDIYFFCAFPLEMAKLTMNLAKEGRAWLRDRDQKLKIPREATENLAAELYSQL